MPNRRGSAADNVASTSYGRSPEEARKMSELIDEGLRRDLEAIKRRKTSRPEIKVMLLGQAESGKSTLRKQFQLFYSSKSLEKERPAWRPVVYSNVIRAVRTIVDVLDAELIDSTDPSNPSPPPSPNSQTPSSSPSTSWPPMLRATRRKLLPLLAIEDALVSEISGGIAVAGKLSDGRSRGAYVRADWQALFGTSGALSWLNGGNPGSSSAAMTSNVTNLASRQLYAVAQDLDALWLHPVVRTLRKSGRLELDESAPFFLDHILRIADPLYAPTNEDILAVRLRSLGIAQHTFDVSHTGTTYSWVLYDVGGARGQRPSWIPFFDDATAIIFLAPISAFDQYLEEDPRVNRIDDSLQLWTLVCTNKLLAKAALILLLNKVDLLKKKISEGVKVRRFVTSYGNRPNTFEEVTEYFRGHFVQVQKRKDPSKRPLYVQFSSVVDIRDSQRIIVSVNDSIVKKHLADSGLT